MAPTPPKQPPTIIGSGLFVNTTMTRDIEWTDPETDVPLRVDLEWQLIGGRMEPVGVTVHSPTGSDPITAAMLRRLPLGAIVTDTREEVRKDWEQAPRPSFLTAEQREDYDLAEHIHRRDASALQITADVYRDAHKSGRSVQQAVADRFGITVSGAAKKISAARKAGFLGEAVGTTAGEQPKGTKK